MPLPQSLYSSPLSRSASTLNITWNDILIDLKGLRPTFKEGFRCVDGGAARRPRLDVVARTGKPSGFIHAINEILAPISKRPTPAMYSKPPLAST